MQQYRSATQILYNFLPEQTVDLEGGVWKVTNWCKPIHQQEVDAESLRRELIHVASPWAAAERDENFVENLRKGREIVVKSLSLTNGVDVEPFPNVWICPSCNRLHKSHAGPCLCGSRRKFGQMHFVAYHECGFIDEPKFNKCRDHHEVRMVVPGTTSAREIRFECPVCLRLLHAGFRTITCPSCKSGALQHMVHRAASVFTPRSVVIVNAPTTTKNRMIAEAGGKSRALAWVVDGMPTRTVQDVAQTPESIRRTLEAMGLSPSAIDRMIEAGFEGRSPDAEFRGSDIPAKSLEAAEDEAVKIALALAESRIRFLDLAPLFPAGSPLADPYSKEYPRALKEAGLETVDLVDGFPILNGQYGYTRGDSTPGASTLRPYRDGSSGRYVVYGDLINTEALFVRLDPMRVAEWLRRRGHPLPDTADPRSARIAVLENAVIDSLGEAEPGSVGDSLASLIHSYSHRFIRTLSVFAGIDRNSISELLMPLHLGFFVYAAGRSDFILGGLQAVYEGELHSFLDQLVHGESRCPMDPGCSRSGGACLGCLHVGEPSCRWFNRHLARHTLFGKYGFMDSSI